jgi:aspartate aminotransferase
MQQQNTDRQNLVEGQSDNGDLGLRLAARIEKIRISPTTLAAARAKDLKSMGRPVISLTTGEPDFNTPAAIITAAEAAMQAGETRYTPAGGTLVLKAAIRQKFLRDNDLVFADNEIIACTGVKQLITTALMTLVQEGDEVLIPVPSWVSYSDMTRLTGAKPVTLPCAETDGFKLTAEALALAITPITRVLILNAPCNPTGAIYSKSELRELGAVLEKHPNIITISDDIYEHLNYTGRVYSTLAQVCPNLRNRILSANGVAKAYAMTGWRIGFAGGPRRLIKAMTKYQSQANGAPCSIAQAAAAHALSSDLTIVKKMRQVYRRRRDWLVPAINAIPGLQVGVPDGAFYLFISVKGLLGKKKPNGQLLTSETNIVDCFLEDGNVAVVAGEAFGLSPYVRVTFAASDDLLKESVRRIAGLVGTLTD